jgi:hypothetical protein
MYGLHETNHLAPHLQQQHQPEQYYPLAPLALLLIEPPHV